MAGQARRPWVRLNQYGPADLLERIALEYVEMPGLKLTMPQARRFWSLDTVTCENALATLVNARFLSASPEGLFVMSERRLDDTSGKQPTGQVPPPLRRRC